MDIVRKCDDDCVLYNNFATNNPVQIEDLESLWLHSTSMYRHRGR